MSSTQIACGRIFGRSGVVLVDVNVSDNQASVIASSLPEAFARIERTLLDNVHESRSSRRRAVPEYTPAEWAHHLAEQARGRE